MCLWTEGQRCSAVEEVRWGPRVCGNSSLPLEVALRLDVDAVTQLFLLQQLCAKVAGHPDKHRLGDCDPYGPSKMVEILV